ncbi:MAG TPA: chloride channel protein, partial [Clostridia bacterium]|nr:chloride channel protein [Clostridia bacterium]
MNTVGKLLDLVQHSERTFLILAAAVVGVVSGFGVILFCFGVEYFTGIFRSGGKSIFGGMGAYYVILLPAFGGLIVGGLAQFFGRDGKGYGVAEIMAAVAFKGGRVRFPAALLKSLASAVCIGSGGSAGLQGPSVHIGGAIGSFLGQVMRIRGKKLKALAACGAAGGIAATFNAPIGGALFAMEVILG